MTKQDKFHHHQTKFPLPFFGIISHLPLKLIAKKIEEIKGYTKDIGCPFDDPLLTIITLTGAAIPFLRICEEGLVNLKDGKTLDLIVN